MAFIFVDMSSLSLQPFWASDMLRLMSLPSLGFYLNNSSANMSFQLILYSGVYFNMLYRSYCKPGVVSFWGKRIIFLFTFEISYSREVALCGVFPNSSW